MPRSFLYRKGKLEDLSRLRISLGLSATSEGIEFNVLGMGHEFWVALEENTIVAITVIGRTASNELTIMYLQVADSHKGLGVGTTLLKAVIGGYPGDEFVVIPFEGTAEFYRRLGFEKKDGWEMRLPAKV